MPDRTPILVRILAGLLIALLSLFTIFNIYIIVNSFLQAHDYPSAFGVTPIVVLPMEEDDKGLEDIVLPGDFLLAFGYDINDYETGDSVAYYFNDMVYIGRIAQREVTEEGKPSFLVRAVYLEECYKAEANEENMLGMIQVRIPYLGYFILFLTSLWGRIIFVGIPFLIYVILLILELRQLDAEDLADIYGGAVLLPNGKVFYSAPWIYLYTAIMSLWAVWFGTEDYRRSERVLRKWQKAQSKLAAPYKPIDLPVGAKDLPRCKPHAMRALRGRRPHGSRRMRTVHTIKPVPMTPVAKKKF
jgi:hypothetical protein